MDTGRRPLVIAHRGASAYLPEHTLVGKALAHGQGADYLEQDVVASRDGVPVVCHDVVLDQLTDVARRFPGRARADGRHYLIDFDWPELAQLQVGPRLDEQGRPVYPGRFAAAGGRFPLVSLDEELAFIRELNRATGRTAGIYTELKAPAWHAGQGVDLAALVLPVLDRHGYLDGDARIFLQCFEAPTLQRLRRELGKSCPPLVQLVGRSSGGLLAAPDAVAQYADALGPSIALLQADAGGGMARARQAGLAVHAYTVRADDLPAGFGGLDELLDLLVRDLAVDGLFADCPDLVLAYLQAAGRPQPRPQ